MFGILNYVEGAPQPQRECYRSCAWFFVIEAEYVVDASWENETFNEEGGRKGSALQNFNLSTQKEVRWKLNTKFQTKLE